MYREGCSSRPLGGPRGLHERGGAASICGASPRGCEANQRQLRCARPLHGAPRAAPRFGEQGQGRSLANVASARAFFVRSCFRRWCAPGEQQRWQQYHSIHGVVYNHMNNSVYAASCMVLEGWGSAGDPRGIRWGSSGDPHAFRGMRHVFVNVGPTF